MKKIISLVLVVMMLLSVISVSLVTSSAADGVTVSYAFSGEEYAKAGFAEGSITVSVTSSSMAGKYYLYWADGTKALEGFRQIGTLNVSANSSEKYKLLDHTAIPPKATKIIAIKSDSVPVDKTVANATAVTNIHSAKINRNTEPLYTFGAFSDPQIANDSYGGPKYPYDEEHWAKALENFDKRGVEFLVSSGDIVNDQNGGVTYAAEYQAYQRILANSPFANPVWECNGNHDVHVNWKSGKAVNNTPFVRGTGINSDADSIKANKAYFEMTEPKTGDHFIFLAQEGGFYTNQGNQFSDAQLSWLEGLLKKYNGDGKNIFIMEHANVEGWGSGDKATSPYLYDLGMKKSQTSTAKLISLMEEYKNCVLVTGHTHLELSAHLNYNDNNGTSAPMIHNSAIGGVRRLINPTDTKTNRDPVQGLSEAYIVEVYADSVIFYGTNIYYNEIMPDCTYIIPMSTSLNEQPTTPPAPPSTEASIVYGDVDLDGKVAVTDATDIQRHIAKVATLTSDQLKAAMVSGESQVTIMDATYIQQLIAKIISKFPVELNSAKSVAMTGSGDVATLLSTAKSDLSKYYIYSSFDQYMNLKKVVKELEATGEKTSAAYARLEAAHNEFLNILTALGVSTGGGGNTGDTIDVYFTNSLNWSAVNAYIWLDGGSNKVSWPGEAMEYVETNSQGQKIYKISVPANVYNRIIFNNGTTQTVDLILSNTNNEGFVPSTQSSGKYNCTTYVYSK